jgi:hypothetical protein
MCIGVCAADLTFALTATRLTHRTPTAAALLCVCDGVFSDPTRPDTIIYGGPHAPKGLSLEIAAGNTVALVSGAVSKVLFMTGLPLAARWCW